ncbi:hypothetical protein [Actinomycetospora atypica]|uniref:Uncharacterized protein n=1 Tax=Actinomycetospora atypica TaxID=1290095 RepID=A0ABV9YGN3_9PSEU
MREAAAQLDKDPGPIKPNVRVGLARLLNAVADQGSSSATGVYVWGASSSIADSVLVEPMDKTVRRAGLSQQDGLYGGDQL